MLCCSSSGLDNKQIAEEENGVKAPCNGSRGAIQKTKKKMEMKS